MTRRHVITGILLLLGGVLLNVGVAWACALASEYAAKSDDYALETRADGGKAQIWFWQGRLLNLYLTFIG